MSALFSSGSDAQGPEAVRALSIGVRSNHFYRIKVGYFKAWHDMEFKATLCDEDGPLYHARARTPYAALRDLMHHPILLANRPFDVDDAQSATRSNSKPSTEAEKSANI